MKSAAGSLLVLMVLASSPLFAQEPPQEMRTLFSVGGEESWGIGIRGQAVGFLLEEPHSNVTIAARLGNGGGRAYVDAYLMRAIGPDASEGDQVAYQSFELPYPAADWFPLFVDLDLEAGPYWLVVAKPRDKTFSSINWFVAKPMLLQSFGNVRYLGTKSYTFLSDEADYIPSSNFKKKYDPYGFQIEITEPVLVPENAAQSR